MNNADMPINPIADGDTGTVSDSSVAWENGNKDECIGLTKREHFAAMALQGILAQANGSVSIPACATDAVNSADALLNELEQTQ